MRRLRIVVPIVVALALLSIVAVALLNPWRVLAGLPIDIGKIVVSGSKITMEAPRMSGFTADNRAYEVSAESAVQDLTNPTLLELKLVNARIGMADSSTVTVTAPRGFFDTKAELLRFDEELWVSSTEGYEARLTEALVDIRKGSVVSEKPATVKLPNGKVDGNRIEVREGGAVVRFDNGVSMTLIMNKPAAGAANAQAAQR